MWGNYSLASSAQACILLLFQAYHSESVCGQVYRYSPHLSISRVTKAQLFSHKRITTTRWSATSHLKSVNACLSQHSPSSVSTMLGPEWFIKPYTKAYNTPLKQKFLFPNATVIIWVSQYNHKLTTLPRAYSSRSCACLLFHPRNHALLLRESLTLSLKNLGSFPPLPMGTTH